MYCISVLYWKIIGNYVYRCLCRTKYVVPLSAYAETAFQGWLVLTHTQKGMPSSLFQGSLIFVCFKKDLSTSVQSMQYILNWPFLIKANPNSVKFEEVAGRPCRLQLVFRLLKVWLLEVDLVLWHCCCDTAEVFFCWWIPTPYCAAFITYFSFTQASTVFQLQVRPVLIHVRDQVVFMSEMTDVPVCLYLLQGIWIYSRGLRIWRISGCFLTWLQLVEELYIGKVLSMFME